MDVKENGTTVKYRIAETFYSIQGEGHYAGTAMFFIRMAGCSVGRPNDKNDPYETCTLWDGRQFTCDTNYKLTETKSITDLLEMIPREVEHVSITGGEPLNQPLMPLITELGRRGIVVHIETSGTVEPFWFDKLLRLRRFKGIDLVWITVSPKYKALDTMIRNADEIKLLIDSNFDIRNVPEVIMEHDRVYLSPINPLDRVSFENTRIAINVILTQRPDWKLATQGHKIWGVR